MAWNRMRDRERQFMNRLVATCAPVQVAQIKINYTYQVINKENKTPANIPDVVPA